MTLERDIYRKFKNEASKDQKPVVFDIDFSKPDAKEKIEQFKTQGIKAFKEFLFSGKEGFLGYAVRRVDSKHYDYIYYTEILYNLGFYENEYRIGGKVYYNQSKSSEKILGIRSKNVKVIEKYIENLFFMVSEGCLKIARANQKQEDAGDIKESKELTVYDAMKKLDADPRIDRCSVTKNSEQNLYVYLNADNIPDVHTIQDVEATVKQLLDDMELSNHFEVIVPKLDESVESDFNTEVARRKFNELCKRIGSALAYDKVKWVEEDPRNFDAWIEALTFLRTALAANKDSAFIDAVNNAEYALDKDRD